MSNIYICTDTWCQKKLLGKDYAKLRDSLNYIPATARVYQLNASGLITFFEGQWSDESKGLREGCIRKYSKFILPKHLEIADDDNVIMLIKGQYITEYLANNINTYEHIIERANKIISLTTDENKWYVDDDDYDPDFINSTPYKIKITVPSEPILTGFDKFNHPQYRTPHLVKWQYKRLLSWEPISKEDLLDTVAGVFDRQWYQKSSNIPMSGHHSCEVCSDDYNNRKALNRLLNIIDALPPNHNLLPPVMTFDETCRLASEAHETKTDSTGKLYKKPTGAYAHLAKVGALVDLEEVREYWEEFVDNEYHLDPKVLTYARPCKVCGRLKLINTICDTCEDWHWTEVPELHFKHPSTSIEWSRVLELMESTGSKPTNERHLRWLKQIVVFPEKLKKGDREQFIDDSDENLISYYAYEHSVDSPDDTEEDITGEQPVDFADLESVED